MSNGLPIGLTGTYVKDEVLMYYLDTSNGSILFREARQRKRFVDKSLLIDELYRYAHRESKYIAITRPRRFGKTMAANMLAAFFTKGTDADVLFDGLAITGCADVWKMRGSFHVIHIDFLPELGVNRSYEDFIEVITARLTRDLLESFPDLTVTPEDDVTTLLSRTGEQFIFIFDEWDAVFEMDFMTDKDKKDYILFLRGLLKNRPYVHLALLTGILPIAKYTSGSPLNMFREFNAFGMVGFEQFYGFSEEEIEQLLADVDEPRFGMKDIRLWYDGYVRRQDGVHMFNPDSVCCALEEGMCRNYWKGTGPMNDISNLIAGNVLSVRDDIMRMVAGEELTVSLDGFGAEEQMPITREDMLSAMVVYGFLTYHDDRLSIPNLELAQKFAHALKKGGLGVAVALETSQALLDALLKGKEAQTAAGIERIHDEQISFIQYSDENSLACVVIYAFYAALDRYEIRREEKAGKGYADFLFTPIDSRYPPIIMELKYNRSAVAAIEQIRQKNYIERMKKYPEVLLVGINYSERTKKHTCRIVRTSYQQERRDQ